MTHAPRRVPPDTNNQNPPQSKSPYTTTTITANSTEIPTTDEMPPGQKRSAAKLKEDSGAEEAESGAKRAKSTPKKKSAQGETGKQYTDVDGNAYWELGGRLRRMTVSEYKGKTLIGIREYFEKDNMTLPGKKGIALSVQQISALVSVLPQLEATLRESGIELPRPVYSDEPIKAVKAEEPEEETKDEEKAEEEVSEEEGAKSSP
ncbi:transcriptional Coactivator p15-domain-containing protein [Tricharina praecox]|uniref:transcriptional Coactivator p15-domain-containing protein n=1 Tax=Tricharina praecox TaxID=43433 RepID=UPI00221F2B87|nr:transcriptional Coactivator p15-domain-containing protein [Tricharina praecox]KAI5859113.1 transcriptional Coactivator p15-domain-containing protein [Tricharina praecox]